MDVNNRQTVRSALIAVVLLSSLVTPLAAQRYSFESLQQAMWANNSELSKLDEEVRRSLLDIKDAKGNRWPTIDLNLTATYMANPSVGPIVLDPDELAGLFDWPQGAQPVASGEYLTVYEGMESTQYQANATITQPVFTWGKIAQSIDLYERLADLKVLQSTDRRHQLAAELAIRLDALLHMTVIEGLLDEQTAIADRLVELAGQAQQNGLLLELDVLKAKVQAAELKVSASKIDHEKTVALSTLRTLTGLADLEFQAIDHAIDIERYQALAQQDPNTLVAKATQSNRPAMAALALTKAVASIATDLERARLYWKPDIAVVVNLGYGGSRLPLIETDWYRQDDYTFNLTLALKTTAWDGGARWRAVQRSLSNQASTIADTQAAIDTIVETVRKCHSALLLAMTTAQWHVQRIAMLQESVDIQHSLFSSGYGDEQAWLMAKLELAGAKIAYEQALLEASVNYHTVQALLE